MCVGSQSLCARGRRFLLDTSHTTRRSNIGRLPNSVCTNHTAAYRSSPRRQFTPFFLSISHAVAFRICCNFAEETEADSDEVPDDAEDNLFATTEHVAARFYLFQTVVELRFSRSAATTQVQFRDLLGRVADCVATEEDWKWLQRSLLIPPPSGQQRLSHCHG
jgi:hypothetical protein